MRLFISNSNSRIPSKAYKKLWILSLSLLLIVLSFSEFFWRSKNFLPNVSDSKLYWGINRERVYTVRGKRKIVIVGASRAQLGIDPEVIKNELSDFDVVHLAIDGINSFYVVRDLAEDPNFDGVIIFCMTAQSLMSENIEESKPWVQFYHDNLNTLANFDKKTNAIILSWLQSNVVITSPRFGLKETLKQIIEKKYSQKPLYAHMQRNRYRPADYYGRMTEKELDDHKEKRINKVKKRHNPCYEKNKKLFYKVIEEDLNELYKLIKNKGGNLVLVRMPVTGESWVSAEQKFPKNIFWNKIAELTDIPTVHFKDYKELNTFNCPDTSHLDKRDSAEFSKRLISIIKDKFKQNKEYTQCLRRILDSLTDLEMQITIAKELNYIEGSKEEKLIEVFDRICRIATNLNKNYNNRNTWYSIRNDRL